MNYLQKKKLAFMSIVNRIKGFVRSVSGVPPLTLPDCVDNDSLINYTIKGNCVQDGTPTPDNPIEVESVGDYDEETRKYKIPVVCSGKNLFKIRTPDKTGVYAYLGFGGTSYKMNDDGSYTISEYGAIGFDFNNLVAGEKYTVSCKFASTATMASGHYCFIGQNMYSGATGVKNARAYDVPNYIGKRLKLTFTADTTNLIAFAVGDCSDTTRVIITDIQLEEGSTATNYEPYVAPVTTNIYLDEPLRKIGNYADYVDFENRKVVKNVSETILKGTESCSIAGIGTQTERILYSLSVFGAMASTPSLCSHTKTTTNAGVGWGGTNFVVQVTSTEVRFYRPFYCEIADFIQETPYEWRQYLSQLYAEGNPFKVYSVRSETAEETFNLPKLPTFKGTTIYTIKTSVQPSDMSATYYATSKE